MKTKIRDAAENFGEEFFRAEINHDGGRLICDLFNHRVKSGILREELEYKNCPLDHTLTGRLLQHFSDAARTFLMTDFS
jgi:hypothetical protein